MSRVLITPAAPNEQELALSLLFSDIPVQQRHLHVARALTVFASGEVDPRTCWLRASLRMGGWLQRCSPRSFRALTAMLWPPRTENVLERVSIEKTILRTLLLRLRAHGVKLAQSFLALEDREGMHRWHETAFNRSPVSGTCAATACNIPIPLPLRTN